jgi:hypothetical protein
MEVNDPQQMTGKRQGGKRAPQAAPPLKHFFIQLVK